MGEDRLTVNELIEGFGNIERLVPAEIWMFFTLEGVPKLFTVVL